MNARSFKVIFSKRLGALVAVGENATSQGKSASGEANRTSTCVLNEGDSASQHVGTLKALCLAALLGTLSPAFALDANALPTQGKVVLGSAAISSIDAAMTITQSTDRAAINWQSFNVGSGASVHIAQPSASSVLLNRVVGNEMSQIRGQISANGQVVLVNPNGIVMGPTGRITASAFTASTFGITDANFKAGHMKYERNGSTGKIVHQGHIQTAEAGGYVALIGADVNNQGTITTRQGAVVLAAADAVTLPSVSAINTVSVPLSSKVRLELNPDSFGSASVSNSGVIVTDGGQVLMRAAAVVDAVSKIADATVIQSGSIDTTGAQGGGVDILADNGRIRVSGSVKANSTNGTAGGDVYIGRDQDTNVLAAIGDVRGAILESKGGFVETSGQFLATYGTRVTAKDWLLDPSDITISNSANSNVTGTSPAHIVPNGGDTTSSIVQVSTIQNAINAGTSVTIKTTNTLNPSGAGNITIADELTFTNNAQDATLTLIADNGIFQNAAITATGSKLVHISMTANGNFRGNPGANTSSRGIVINRNITTNGDITLTATIDNPSGNTEAIRFSNTNISARSYKITGTNANAAVLSHGVVFSGNNTFTATEDSSIRGVTRGGSWPPSMGVYYLNGSNTTFNSGNGRTTVVGVLTGDGASGTRVSFDSGANITTNSSSTGSVTLGSNEAGASFFHRRGTIRADSGKLNILGSSITTYEPGAIIQGDNGTTINLSANSVALGTGPGGASRIRPEANGGFTLNIATDRLVVHPGSTTSSGTGTTTIQNFTSGTRINLGGDDVSASDGNPATLGLSQAEIASFTAGNLRFGSDTSGPITVTQALSLNKIHITSKDNIRIDAALTATAINAVDAVIINAGVDKSAGDKTGGDIILGSGGSINVSNGSRATLYTGSVEGSTTAAAKASNGNFRYNSDETQSNFTKGLGVKRIDTNLANNGVYVIYREAPEIMVTAKSSGAGVLTYNGMVQNNPNNSLNPNDSTYGVTDNLAEAGVLKNGDRTSLSGDLQLAYAKGSETELKNAGTYRVIASGLTNDLGYKVSFTEGALEIDKAKLTEVKGEKIYDGNHNLSNGTLTIKGVNGEEFITDLATVTLASKNVADNATNSVTNISALALTSKDNSTTELASNYDLSQGAASNSVTITPKPLTIIGLTIKDKTFDGTTAAEVSNPGSLDGLVDGEVLSLSATGIFEDPNVDNNKRVLVTPAIADRGNGLASNYRLLPVEPTPTASITAATEPVAPARPVVPVIPATPTNNNVVIAGGANSFQLASAEGSCTANTLEQCECEAASNNIQICYEPSSQAQ
jgi:filamentous hemagglutinin family protein